MRFLDSDIQINSETIFSLLKPVIPSPLTAGLLCLAGGISYYSWNYYKNKKGQYMDNKESEIKRETSINDIKNIITNNKSNINKKKKLCEDKINLAKIEEKKTVQNKINVAKTEEKETVWYEINLAKAEEEIIEDINDNDWEMIDTPANSSNCL